MIMMHGVKIRYRGYYYDNESGLYYLQSRYYDPTTGRFVNADSIIDGSSKFLSCNIFVYAANNPVNCSDPTGKSLIIDWIASKIEKVFSSSVNTFRNSFENGTVSVGIDATASYIACVNIQAAFVFDSAGYTAFQVTVSGGASTSKGGASVGVAVSESNAPSYRDLEGGSTQYGGSFADGIAVAAEGALFGEYHEFAANTGIVGVGTPGGEVHLQTGYTSTLWAYNFMTGEWGTTNLME